MDAKLYQITEDDLAILEAELPRLMEASMLACNDPVTRKRWSAVKTIVSNVRWDYGPPDEIHQLDSDPHSD